MVVKVGTIDEMMGLAGDEFKSLGKVTGIVDVEGWLIGIKPSLVRGVVRWGKSGTGGRINICGVKLGGGIGPEKGGSSTDGYILRLVGTPITLAK